MRRLLACMLLAVLLALGACAPLGTSAGETAAPSPAAPSDASASGTASAQFAGETLKVHVIDCGQGDAILLLQGEHAMLIDAGDTSAGDAVLSYLQNAGVQALDLLVATHPHADHIGGMDVVLGAIPASEVWMPDVTATTRVFEELLDAIDGRGLSVTVPEVGDTAALGAASVAVLAPQTPSEGDLNNASLVLRVTFGKTVFLFTGDAEAKSEAEMLSSGLPLQADVLKVGHHGSQTSSSEAFLDAVSPSIAVISVGEGNDYGHPHRETLDKLAERGVAVLRTDLLGTVVFVSDGKTVTVAGQAAPASPQATATAAPQTGDADPYIGNVNSHVFHRSACQSLPAEKNRVYFDTREEAVEAGYAPCGRCAP